MPRRFNDLDLNLVTIPTADGETYLGDYSARAGQARVDVYFRDLDVYLIKHIESASYVFGCVAWMTHPKILDALAKKTAAQIIVQKEDFLRPDSAGGAAWKTDLRERYERIKGADRPVFNGVLAGMSSAGDPTMNGVRCVGVTARKGESAPRCHHKFLVLCQYTEREKCPSCSGALVRYLTIDGSIVAYFVCKKCYAEFAPWDPVKVWTGSFNFTNNATRSFENAVVIHDKIIAEAYMREYQQIAALSEPLDWSSEYINPEWRFGT